MSKLREGDLVLVCDKKNRQRMFVLKKGKQFSLYNHQFKHDVLIGLEEGSALFRNTSHPIFVFRPSIRNYIMNMRRNVQPIYPKDLGLMVFYANLKVGSKVIEVGLGAGALSITILNAIGDNGRLVTYERRDDFALEGRQRVESFLGQRRNFEVIVADAAGGIKEKDFDAGFIDVPEPWAVVDNVANAVKPGANILAFIPTTVQIKQYWDKLKQTDYAANIEIFETMFRNWDAGIRSLRPTHTMVGHTGFVVMFRKVIVDTVDE